MSTAKQLEAEIDRCSRQLVRLNGMEQTDHAPDWIRYYEHRIEQFEERVRELKES